MDETLLSRIEDAGLNASAPPQQRWLDGWLVRTLPGKARRARCINALAPGRLPLDQQIAQVQPVFDAAGVPLLFRITRFTQPPDLDAALAQRGYGRVDPTLVLVCRTLPSAPSRGLPPGLQWIDLNGADFADVVGALRDSPPEHRSSHALRLAHSPVPYRGYALRRASDGLIVACGQSAQEGEFVGLYDVFTHAAARGSGLATVLCERMLSLAAASGAKTGYLQVDAQNHPALAVYRRLGFVDGYGYHYRERPAAV